MRTVFGYLAAVGGRLRVLARALLILWVPVIAAAGGIGVMATGQMRESVGVLMEDFRGLDQIAQPAFAVTGVLAAAFAIWFCSRFFSLCQPLYDTGGGSGSGLRAVPRDADARHGKRLAYMLAVLPVVIAAGYLAFCFNQFWWAMRAAGLAGFASAWFVLAVLVAATLVVAFSAVMLVFGILREPPSNGIIDGLATRALFGPAPNAAAGVPARHSPNAETPDLITAYGWLGRGLQRLLQALAGRIDDDTLLARAYRLEPPRRVSGSIPAPAVIAGPKLSTASKMVAAAGLDTPAPTPRVPKGLPLAGIFGTANTSAPPALPSTWSQLRHASAAWQHIVMLPVLALTAAAALLLLSPLAFVVQAPGIPEAIGTVAIVQAFVVVLLLALTALYRRSEVLILIAVVAFAVAALDWNDDHAIRPLASTATPAAEPPSIQAPSIDVGFAQWLDGRRDKARYERYPVYVVAAPGGGIYAAYHAAIFLARMQDVCPAFAQHVFAISSVSGGSVGAGVFAALAKAQALNAEPQGAGNGCQSDAALAAAATGAFKPGPFEQRAREILARDLLSPAVSAALFADLVLQALPVCPTDQIPFLCLKGFDRARALEVAIENAWPNVPNTGATGGNPLAESFYALWSPSAATPALLVNTTGVESGDRVVIAPFKYLAVEEPQDVGRQHQVATLLNTAGDLDLRLSTAVGISARFPGISPAAWYRVRQYPDGNGPLPPPGDKRRLVDGGYFDNSGLATALDAVDAIVRTAPNLPDRKSIDVRLVVLAGLPTPAHPGFAFGELLSAPRALFNTRESHGRRIEELARARIAAGSSVRRRPGGPVALAMSYAVLDTGAHTLPLGWQLSRDSRAAIETAAGRLPATADCTKSATARTPTGVLSGRDESSCTMAAIRAELMRRR